MTQPTDRRAWLDQVDAIGSGALLFELANGNQRWRLYEDGRVEGFPVGTWVVNHAHRQRGFLMGLLERVLRATPCLRFQAGDFAVPDGCRAARCKPAQPGEPTGRTTP